MKIGNIIAYGIIYKIINKTNGKCYIGQTTKSFNERYSASGKGIERVYSFYDAKRNRGDSYNNHLLNSIEKYGFDCWEIVEVYDIAFSKEELDIKEKYYIDLFDCINNGYNNDMGGSNGRHSDKSKIKIGKNTKKMWENMTEEQISNMKEKISKATKGENNPMYGKNPRDYMTEEAKRERDKKQSITVSGKNNPFAKSVICLTTKQVFYTVREAELFYKVRGVSACCRGRQKSAGKLNGEKLVWKYITIIEL